MNNEIRTDDLWLYEDTCDLCGRDWIPDDDEAGTPCWECQDNPGEDR